MLLLSAAVPREASADPLSLNARVLWTHADRVYLAAPDSRLIEPGKLLSLSYRGREVASARVESIHYKELAVARLVGGSLVNVTSLDSIEVLAQSPALRPLAHLRIGYPSSRRSNLIFACPGMTVNRSISPASFRVDPLGEDSYRMVREPGPLEGKQPWPDTLVVRQFDEVADQEIALERGELDIAVFWPGELSAHMRQNRRFQPQVFGTPQRGVIASVPLGRDPLGNGAHNSEPAEQLDMDSFNQELFRGDLVSIGPAAAAGGEPDPPAAGSRAARFRVERTWPGRRMVERFLNRRVGTYGTQDRPDTLLLVYLDAPVSSSQALAHELAARLLSGGPPELRARADTMLALAAAARSPSALDALRQFSRERMRVRLLFALRCPVLCQPELREHLDALGADVLANLMLCREANQQP